MSIRHTRARAISAAATVAAAAVALSLSTTAANAATTDLGPIGFGTVIVDSAHRHVLVSGTTANVVDVLSYAGEVIATIPDIYGADGMVIDGDMLYVAESTDGSIAQINLETLTASASPLVSGLDRPRWLAVVGGALWIVEAAGSAFEYHGVLASVKLATHKLKVDTNTTYYAPFIVASPADPGTLFLTEEGLSPGSVYRLRVSASGRVAVAKHAFPLRQENIEGMAVSPDGTRVIPVSGAPYEFEELSAKKLKPDGIVYPGEAYPNAVAVSGRSADLLAGGICGGSGPDIRVYPIGVPAPVFTATTPPVGERPCVTEHGLALSEDGEHLFAAYIDERATELSSFEIP